MLRPGLRLAVALSGGADSVALLRALAEQNAQKGRELGLVLHVAHLHHGLRGAEADADLAFCRELAGQLGLPFHDARVNTVAEARANSQTGKRAESVEEAARRLRYAWFRQLAAEISLDAVATAHTLDDQAETVLGKFLRGAWTEGLSGIHPTLERPRELASPTKLGNLTGLENPNGLEKRESGGLILRPLLNVTRTEIEAYLNARGQTWREDSFNRDPAFTRNRIRHELLPLLEGWNPQLRAHLAQMAALARDEEAFWQAELARLAPQLILPGTPVRGGGRASGEGLALECMRLAVLPPALQRRLLRHAAERLGAALDFAATESLRALVLTGRAGQKLTLAGVHAERTARELRLAAGLNAHQAASRSTQGASPESCTPTEGASAYNFPIPGEIDAPAFGLRLRVEVAHPAAAAANASSTALLRNWKPGDRVRLRHSSGPRKVKEVLEHLRVTGSARTLWPVLELGGSIVWMQGVEVEPLAGFVITAAPLAGEDPAPPSRLASDPSLS